MHEEADYKKLFSQPQKFEELLRGFLPEDWILALDFSTLERIGASYVADDLRHRHDDVIWRVRFAAQWLYVYLLIPGQNSGDGFTAAWITSYIGLLYQDLSRHQTPHSGPLPAVLPLVFYTGETPWTAPLERAELQDPVPAELQAYQPQQRYFLLDENAFGERSLTRLRKAFAGWIQQKFLPDWQGADDQNIDELEALQKELAKRAKQE
ncbi:MAG: Rpn family recombination-promoting nuclease/putative transposase [Gammaproteobacteria bacterium]|nr:Rpn family recombination-promoting nuclease/putative transposase [Gammaproteobacteria bacterium]MCP5458744.1 Rpn family recombination-promoting nuclease/putative transposase [Gammaproteobacteria bacterium]